MPASTLREGRQAAWRAEADPLAAPPAVDPAAGPAYALQRRVHRYRLGRWRGYPASWVRRVAGVSGLARAHRGRRPDPRGDDGRLPLAARPVEAPSGRSRRSGLRPRDARQATPGAPTGATLGKWRLSAWSSGVAGCGAGQLRIDGVHRSPAGTRGEVFVHPGLLDPGAAAVKVSPSTAAGPFRLARPRPFRQLACMPAGVRWWRRWARQVWPNSRACGCCLPRRRLAHGQRDSA